MIYLLLFLEFFKIGLFTFGGGYAMIPLIKETILQHQWLTENEFYNFIGICESTPGPIAVNMATYIGAKQGDILGSIMATLGVILPSFIIIILIAIVLKNILKNPYIKAFLDGVKPVIIGLILATGVILLSKALGYINIRNFDFNVTSLIVFLILIIIYFGVKKSINKKISALAIIFISAILGIVVSAILI